MYICKTNQVNVKGKVKKKFACKSIVVVISSMWVIFCYNFETILNCLFLLREKENFWEFFFSMSRMRDLVWRIRSLFFIFYFYFIFLFYFTYLIRIIVFQLWSNSYIYLFICLSIIYLKLVFENQHMTFFFVVYKCVV